MKYLPQQGLGGRQYPWVFVDVRLGEMTLLTPNPGGRRMYRERVRGWLDDRAYVIGPQRRGKPGKNNSRVKGLPVPRAELTTASGRYWLAVDDPVDPSSIILLPAEGQTPEITGGDGLVWERLYISHEKVKLVERETERWVEIPDWFMKPLLNHILGSGKDVADRPAVFIHTDGRNLMYTRANYWKPGGLRRVRFVHPLPDDK